MSMEWIRSLTQDSKIFLESSVFQSVCLFALTFFGLNFLKEQSFSKIGIQWLLKITLLG